MKELASVGVTLMNRRRTRAQGRIERGWILSRAWGGSELRIYKMRTADASERFVVVYQSQDHVFGGGTYAETAAALRRCGYRGDLPYGG